MIPKHYRIVTINGQSKNITDWCKDLNLNKGTIYNRLKRWKDEQKALTKPIKRRIYD